MSAQFYGRIACKLSVLQFALNVNCGRLHWGFIINRVYLHIRSYYSPCNILYEMIVKLLNCCLRM